MSAQSNDVLPLWSRGELPHRIAEKLGMSPRQALDLVLK